MPNAEEYLRLYREYRNDLRDTEAKERAAWAHLQSVQNLLDTAEDEHEYLRNQADAARANFKKLEENIEEFLAE